MSTERNWAEHDRQIREDPTLKQAYETGKVHAAYGWASSPWGSWSQENKDAYAAGFKGESMPEGPKPKYGEPGFTFPPCDQCGSTSLRCGCD